MKKDSVAILPTRRGIDKHTFYFKFEQSIDAHVTKAGNTVDEFTNFMEETVETTEAITNENLAATAYNLFKNFVRSSYLQRTKGFKTSQPIVVTFGIDGRIEKRKTTFSINPNRMEKRMREMAELTLLMFSNPEKMHKTTFANVLTNSTTEIKLLVDKITKDESAKKSRKKVQLLPDMTKDAVETFNGVAVEDNFLPDDNS